MGLIWFNSETPLTKFAPNLKIPLYKANEGSDVFFQRLTDQMLVFEKHIEGEELVSEVPKSKNDPYPWTQHWKQHSIFWDKSVKDGEHFKRFEMTSDLEKLFHIIRKHYLLYLKELNYPRIECYIHGWANVLRKGQWISLHHHMADATTYLSGTYYPTSAPTSLKLINPIRIDQTDVFPTEKGNLVMFPSYVPHESSVYNGDELRISIAFDISTAANTLSNPWRPHCLFDDPVTMEGLEMYLKDRTLTA
jgi:hypothetical protein